MKGATDPLTRAKSAWRRARRAAEYILGTPEGQLTEYVHTSPSPQNALNIFAGEWSSRLPSPFAELQAGSIPLFDDPRMVWAIEHLGGVAGHDVLELGPLEGGHTYMLEQAGARSITAIESNTRAFLKCLVIKEVLGLNRSRFLYGDFVEYLRANTGPYDTCVASGVLYHVRSPAEMLARLGSAARNLYLWTHYFDQSAVERNQRLKGRVGAPIESEHGGFRHRVYPFVYAASPVFANFCGGSARSAYWLSREDILAALTFFGFTKIEIGFEEPDHPNGPSFAIVAKQP